MIWKTPSREFTFDRPLVMGIVNVTPDSFSDGGQYLESHHAADHALQLITDGADIIDIGGESTRPGATPTPEAEELRRVVPVIQALAKQIAIPISIDTIKPGVAKAAIEAGAEIVNDVSGLRDPTMVKVVRDAKAAAIVMHMRGTPQTMQNDPQYFDVVREVGSYFDERIRALSQAGIDVERTALDPGFGFGKTSVHNWQLLAGLSEFRRFGRPLCLGVSRKGFLGKDRQPCDRLIAGIAVSCHGIALNAVQIVRTHDVKQSRDAIDALTKIQRQTPSTARKLALD
jgi:dihydropteroate synthase